MNRGPYKRAVRHPGKYADAAAGVGFAPAVFKGLGTSAGRRHLYEI